MGAVLVFQQDHGDGCCPWQAADVQLALVPIEEQSAARAADVKPCWPKIQAALPMSNEMPVTVELKCWRQVGAQHQWELRRWAAFILARAPLELGRYLKRELLPARQTLRNIIGEDFISPPRLQVVKANGQLDDNMRDQWAAGTPGFVYLLGWAACAPGSTRDPVRTLARKFVIGFLQCFVLVPDCMGPDPGADPNGGSRTMPACGWRCRALQARGDLQATFPRKC